MPSRISHFFKFDPGAKAATVVSAGGSAYLFYQSISNIDFSHFNLAKPSDLYMFGGANILGVATIGLLIYLYRNRVSYVGEFVEPSNPLSGSHGNYAGVRDQLIEWWKNDDFQTQLSDFNRNVNNREQLLAYADKYPATGGTWSGDCRSSDPNFLQNVKRELAEHAKTLSPTTPS